VRFGALNVTTEGGNHSVSVQVWLDELPPDSVAVEVYAENKDGSAPLCFAMTRGPALAGTENGFTWTVKFRSDRHAADFTPRVVPAHAGAEVPLECSQILWYR